MLLLNKAEMYYDSKVILKRNVIVQHFLVVMFEGLLSLSLVISLNMEHQQYAQDIQWGV